MFCKFSCYFDGTFDLLELFLRHFHGARKERNKIAYAQVSLELIKLV